MPTWLTADEIARRFGRPVSTIRSWRDRHRAFVPEEINDAGHQTYPLEILEAIRLMRAEGMTPREITAELERRHGSGGQSEPAPSFEMAVLDRLDTIISELRRIANHLDPPPTEEG